jgi:hypothetical protein
MIPDFIFDFSNGAKGKIKFDPQTTIALAVTFMDTTDPTNPVAIDLTDYAFEFDLRFEKQFKKSYTIASGEMSNAFLNKSGSPTPNILDESAMWADIKTQIGSSKAYNLVMVMTTPAGQTLVAAIFYIDVTNY